ncbi:hypothetical protein PG996_008352 [Apiospora saccharicola]|uniref:Uncharacterized protein n=1 Tax=Apiospora saccharicola TaxID=335842 RepID=A0ABR1UXS6_9PEZI
MLYPMNFKHFIRALTRPLIKNVQISLGLRHLALPLLDIAYWPDEDKQQLHDPSTHPEHSPWLLPGLLDVLKDLRSLESIRLVVGRLFSVPFGVPYRRVKRQETPGSVALITTRTQLRDLAKSQARDAYGFSDYTAFVDIGGYQWPIDFPREMFHPSDQANPTPLPGPSEMPTELPFGTYDPFFRQVLGELRRLASPPLYPHRTVDVRLVVDLDSNANGVGSLMRPRDYREEISFMDRPENDEALRYGEYRDELVPGYDRYFANLNSVLEWYEDVSGHARSIKGYENATEAERNADDPYFVPTQADLDNLSDGSGPDSAYGYGASKKKKRKPRAAKSKTTKTKTAKPVEESDEDSEYVPPDYSEDDSPSD